MKRTFISIVTALLTATGAAGCSEDPQVLHVSGPEAARADQQNAERRERTLNQNESQRIY